MKSKGKVGTTFQCFGGPADGLVLNVNPSQKPGQEIAVFLRRAVWLSDRFVVWVHCEGKQRERMVIYCIDGDGRMGYLPPCRGK